MVFARTWPLSRVVFACAWPLSRSPQLCFICIFYSATGQGVRSQRSKIGPNISQISRDIWQISWRSEIDRLKVLKGARCSQSVRKLLFPFARARARCRRNGPLMQVHGGIRVQVTPKFCEPAARLDGLVNLRWRSNGLEGQIEPEKKRHGPTRVRCWCINALVTCDPRQNENRYAWTTEGRSRVKGIDCSAPDCQR